MQDFTRDSPGASCVSPPKRSSIDLGHTLIFGQLHPLLDDVNKVPLKFLRQMVFSSMISSFAIRLAPL